MFCIRVATNSESADYRIFCNERNLNENDKTFEIHESFWNCFEEVAPDNNWNSNTVANEKDFYVKTTRLERKADLSSWWSANENLWKVAKVYFSSSGSSVDRERLFSDSGVAYMKSVIACCHQMLKSLFYPSQLTADEFFLLKNCNLVIIRYE